MTEIRLLYVTTKDTEQAKSIAKELLEKRLIACANILPGMESLYWWQGKIQQDREAILILKTRTENVSAVTEEVKRLHSYECPCVLSLSVDEGNPAYVDWLKRESTTAT